MSELTSLQYDKAISRCKDIYIAKMKDYGSAWRILRATSLTDQIQIKANRIRSIETKGEQKVTEGIDSEFIGIINYSIMALIQIELGTDDTSELEYQRAVSLYDSKILEVKNLMLNKNHDYGEAWREMRVSSMTDLILMKLKRIKQIEDNQGATLISEGVDANYQDIINYAVFALIKLDESK